ncbi:hypothetical protein R6Q57_007279 [Mikania cordata]
MDTADHWPQEIMKPMEEIGIQNNTNSCSKPSSNSSSLERKARPQKESAVNCPRCNSTNTKFCYYNNYSLSQPRYFCKTCRRYWTEGGSLRNVPVGGGSRKNKRSSSSISPHSSMSKKLPDLVVPNAPTPVLFQDHRMHHEHTAQELNLGFPSTNDFKTFSEHIQVPNFYGNKNPTSVSATTNSSAQFSALELLPSRGMMNPSMPIPIPDPNSVCSSSGQMMIPALEFKISSLSFSLDGMEGNDGGGTYSIHESSNGMHLLPFEDLKTSTMTTTHDGHHNVEHNRDQNGDANGFWCRMLGGGSW